MPDVPVVRLNDPAMADEMAAYALHFVIGHQRAMATVRVHQREHVWQEPFTTPSWDFRVGILGYGSIGRRIGDAFAALGYPVRAWSRTERETPGVVHYAGRQQLSAFLADCDAVVNVLPSTPETRHALDESTLAEFRDGSILVNIGRGATVDEASLLDALDRGPLAAAVLDVTDPEPPDAASPLWDHPQVTLTPHISGRTRLETSARLVVDNIERIRSGRLPFPLLDRARGY